MKSFENDPIDLDMLPQWETVSFYNISKKYRFLIVTNTVLIWLLALAILAIVVVTSDEGSMDKQVWIGTSIFLTLLCGVYLVFNLISFRRRGYAIRQHDVLYRAGVFSQYTVVIPIKHIQHIKVKTSVIGRLLGLVSVELFTAGAGKDMHIAGLDNQHALALQQHLSERVSTIDQQSSLKDA
ncbi:PH domain-containing protein [Sphingobacterium sp. lm-10]|uniref:PH domain-containing protein n=1 Tax=Sphingobacterium sp. lm-10 TaxID=2944904 RepID=UPI002021FF27|nr:PH domain-containing protein [Sphingobacterium sp. lm-10]MCL7989409.1 PH domain-containing protein [Sphingobacterium sp. lm-10]